MIDAHAQPHAAIDSLARRIAPRGLRSPAEHRDERACVALTSDRLDATERIELAALVDRGGTLSPLSVRGECALITPRSHLAAAAELSRLARALLHASDSAATIPGAVHLMGVVNVTPDSFSDGGSFRDAPLAVEHGLELAAAGAEILDVGGESTRPGARPVTLEEELARVIPVVSQLARRAHAKISIDTQKSEVARQAIECGASIVNDVSAGRFDPRMLACVAERGATYVAMHMQGSPADMQSKPTYGDPVADVLEFLRERAAACASAGIEFSKIWIDPGIGFGKRLEHNLELLRRLFELRSLGIPICLGVSRKSFIAGLARDRAESLGLARSEEPMPIDRRGGTAAAVTVGILAGAEMLRVHDVAAMHEAVAVASALTPWSTRDAMTRDR